MLYAFLALFSLTSVFYAPAPASVQLVCHSSMSALMPWANYTLYRELHSNKLCDPDYHIARWEFPDQGDIDKLFDLAMVAQRKANQLRAIEMKKLLEQQKMEQKLKEEKEKRERQEREEMEMKRHVYYYYRCIQAVILGILALINYRQIFAGLRIALPIVVRITIVLVRNLNWILWHTAQLILFLCRILWICAKVLVEILFMIDRLATWLCNTIIFIYEIIQTIVENVQRGLEDLQEFVRDSFIIICILLKIAVVAAIAYPLIVFYDSLESELMRFLFHCMVSCALFIFVFIYAMLNG
jgi:hypothetical protein